jgi:hypothetical protein
MRGSYRARTVQTNDSLAADPGKGVPKVETPRG